MREGMISGTNAMADSPGVTDHLSSDEPDRPEPQGDEDAPTLAERRGSPEPRTP